MAHTVEEAIEEASNETADHDETVGHNHDETVDHETIDETIDET